MNSRNPLSAILLSICLSVWICFLSVLPAFAYESTTLYNGSKGEDVRELQQALIDLGYLKGTADGIFGNKTEIAVRKFQKANKLSVDGLAGLTTRELILKKSQSKKVVSTTAPAPVTAAPATPAPDTSVQAVSNDTVSTAKPAAASSGNFFPVRLLCRHPLRQQRRPCQNPAAGADHPRLSHRQPGRDLRQQNTHRSKIIPAQ